MGGDCLHTGCVPSKALLRSAKLLADIRRAAELGIRNGLGRLRLRRRHGPRAARRRRRSRRTTRSSATPRLGVTCVEGTATITSPWTVDVTARRRHDVARSRRPTSSSQPVRGRSCRLCPAWPRSAPLTSDTVWGLRTLPRRLVVLGGGPIGCELAQAFARFGAQVTQVEMGPRLLTREDAEFSALVAGTFAAEGIDVRVGHKALASRSWTARSACCVEHAGADRARLPSTRSCVAVGRVANTTGYGLEALGVPTRPRAPWRSTASSKRGSRTSWPVATWPGPTSSRTPPRTPPGSLR